MKKLFDENWLFSSMESKPTYSFSKQEASNVAQEEDDDDGFQDISLGPSPQKSTNKQAEEFKSP